MIIKVKNKETLKIDLFKFKCSIGKKGFTKKKVEGDKKTPIGKFKIGSLYYRKDRIAKFETSLKKIQIRKNMGWCNDINSKKYNQLITINKKIKHERLYRKDYKYDLLIPIHYNTNPIIKNKGSAIFIHLTKNYKETVGCVALSKKDFLILLKIINSKTKIEIF
tara:strand:- start:109 stop:600 length:492 start_codon:yes stop_codon:yes gene_type:complete